MNNQIYWINDPLIVGQICTVTIRHPETGAVLIGVSQVVTPDWVEYLDSFGVDSVTCQRAVAPTPAARRAAAENEYQETQKIPYSHKYAAAARRAGRGFYAKGL